MELERRHIRLEGGSNLRDIGGYAAAGGKKVRWGQVYRSGALWGLSDAGWDWMERQRIAAVCDLRSDGEREIAPTVWRGGAAPRQLDTNYAADHLFGAHHHAGNGAGVGELEISLYLKFARLLAPSLRELFGALVGGEVPVIVHCTAGQDRTGLAVSLLLSALEVDRSTIHADYLLSTELRIPDNEMDRNALIALADRNVVARFYTDLIRERGPDVFVPRRLVDGQGSPLVDVALSAIEGEWGSVENYMATELCVGPAELRELRNRLLEQG
ncbi:tyrosine-protein phosphatase [Novosphingobium sp. KCTC 2891]|uniref:tyrosine-protein phosphatase n=1 Tax=Novosphingobium sp. KCTC 2891 TaxID=2989730 RepID=UPI0022228F55|nr:tyrosine-protein phosphatase [Novosphingobium sp. KCTC 2891]MCW1383614.1 tyrosine-protein phosphatase [Novosphingobium sp. KCTC 2891]